MKVYRVTAEKLQEALETGHFSDELIHFISALFYVRFDDVTRIFSAS